jgi:hypothetical protein
MELHNKEGLNCFSTSGGSDGCLGGDGYTINKPEVVDESKQKCEICDKCVLKSNFKAHLNSGRHTKKVASTVSNQQQPQQSNANHIQPHQQHNNLGIQSLIDADRGMTINYDTQLMEKIMAKGRTISSIPTILRRPVAAAKIKLLNDISSDPSNVSKHVLLIIFSKVVLATIPYELYWKTRMGDRQKKQNEYTRNRLQKWNDGGLSREALVTSSIDSIKNIFKFKINTDAKNRARCKEIIRNSGQNSKAIRALSSHGIAPNSVETNNKLREKLPLGPLPIKHDLSNIIPLSISMHQVCILLRRFPKGSACANSGDRAQHHLDLIASGLPYGEALTIYLNLLLGGKAPDEIAPYIGSAHLIPLLKPDDSIRPIAVGEILRRLLSSFCARSITAKVKEHLGISQQGIGKPNAIETILVGLNRLINEENIDPNTTLALIDFRNAFCEVERQWFIDEVYRLFPEISPWVQYIYGCRALMFTGDDICYSHIGVQQGDPLGPLLFCLVLALLLMELSKWYQEQGLSVPNFAFLDDLTLLFKSIQDGIEGIKMVKNMGSKYGLFVNQKTLLFQPCGSSTVSTDLCIREGIKLCTENGVKLLGGCVSRHDEFFTTFMSIKIDSAVQNIKMIMKLEDHQICTRLLDSTSGTNKVNHLYRSTNPKHVKIATEILRNVLKSSLRTCLAGNRPGFGEFAYTMASLPSSKGGFGVTDPRVLEQYAYIAMYIETCEEQSKLFPQLPTEYPPVVIELINKYIENFPAAVRESIKEQTLLPHNKKQKQLAMMLTSEIRSSAICKWTVKHKEDPYLSEKLLVLESATAPFTSLWQRVLPNSGLRQTMTDREFNITCMTQLVIPFMKGGTCVECGKIADPMGYHNVTCTGTCNANHERHQVVVKAYNDVATVAGLHPRIDAPVKCLGVKNGVVRPADLLLDGNNNDKMCVDITVVSPFLASATRPFQVGKAAKDAESKKYRKNLEPCESSSYDFMACAADVLGVIPVTSYSFIKRLAKAYSAKSGKPYADCLSICCRRICFSIRLGVARQLSASKMFLDNLFVDNLIVED